MSRQIFCVKLQKEAEGLDVPPIPGTFGKKIFENISKEAWEQWLARQTMIINEYRLQSSDPQSRSLLKSEMEKFLFGDATDHPPGYVPPKES